jgi:hypothetical protein
MDRRIIMALAASSVALAGACRSPKRDVPWDLPTVSGRLTAAGFVVTSAKNPGIAGAGIVAVDCIDAARSSAVDTFCVARCSTPAACQAFAEGTWESYGTFQAGSSLLVHQVCGRPIGAKTSFDCTQARRPLGI